MNALSIVAFIVGWLKGGHPERFGVTVLLFHAVAEQLYRHWRIGDGGFELALYVALAEELAVGRLVLALIFGWLALRSPRWWPLPVTASLVLIVLVHLLTIMTPMSYTAGASARIGFWLLVYVALLAGVAERWMAGETPVSRIVRTGTRETILVGRGPMDEQWERPASPRS